MIYVYSRFYNRLNQYKLQAQWSTNSKWKIAVEKVNCAKINVSDLSPAS